MTLSKLLAQVGVFRSLRHQHCWAKLKALEKEVITPEHYFPTISGNHSTT